MLKNFDWLFAISLFVGFVIVIGTVGASRFGLIADNEAIKQALIGSLALAIGFIGLTITEDD